MTALSFPALTEVGGKFRVESLDGLVTVRCDELVKIGGALELRLLPKLKSAYFQKVSIFIFAVLFLFFRMGNVNDVVFFLLTGDASRERVHRR